ncbi:MAG TPA: AraC family transcriptional regulator, partial [Rheinheimera sp.]|nr:AraC family transcriptional regulator [Rheinheimera sp.]
MSDPLTDIVALLNPKPSHSKLVEGAGTWRIVREAGGEAFFCAVLAGECLININGEGPQLLV